MKKVAVIGAGAAGLAATWDLVRAGYPVTVYEAADRVGGLAAGFKEKHWRWFLEKFYHHWFASDASILKLAEDLGVKDQVIFKRPKTSMWTEQGFFQFDSPWSVLRFPLLSWPAKFRLGLCLVYLKLTRNWKALEQQTAEEWLLKYMGREAYEKIWKPLLIGKFGALYKKANMAWMWARLYNRTARLGSFEGGFQAFMELLADRIRKEGGEIKLSVGVEKVIPSKEGFSLFLSSGKNVSADVVLSTSSPFLLQRMIPELKGSYLKKLESLKSFGAVIVLLALRRPLLEGGEYWLNLPVTSPDKSKSRFPFLALVEQTHFMDAKNYGGDHVVYCGDYVPASHEYFKLSEKQLADKFISALPAFNSKFSKSWIRKWWVFRTPYAQPLFTVNYSKNIPDIRTPIKGLYWASMSQVYPWDRGTNYAVEIGQKAARLILEDL